MSLTRTSRYISLILRHKPETIGITLDEHGWANVDELVAGVNRTHPLTMELLEEIVRTDEKQRYSFNEDKTLIRANQGHSIPVDVELPELEPPAVLYHGTACDKFIYIKTIAKSKKSPDNFCFTRDSLLHLPDMEWAYFRDFPSYAALHRRGNELSIDFTWITDQGGVAVVGYLESVRLNYSALARFAEQSRHPDGPQKWLTLAVDETMHFPRITFKCPGTLKKISSFPVLRHKLSVALRDNFQWPGSEEIVLYPDHDSYNFFFCEYRNGIAGICGEMTLSNPENIDKASYSIHT